MIQGSREIVKVRERKEKHTWSVQVMEELLARTSMYEYEDNGRSPHHLTSIERDHGETTPYSIVDGNIVKFRHDSFIDPIVHDDHDPTSKPRDSPSKVGFHENGVRSDVSDGKGKCNFSHATLSYHKFLLGILVVGQYELDCHTSSANLFRENSLCI